MAAKTNITQMLKTLAAAEEQFAASRFLAPVLRGRKVQVRIAAVRCRLAVQPPDFHGWGLFRPLSLAAAELLRPASMAERRRYLELFPSLSAVLCGRTADGWLAMPATADNRFQIEGLLTVQLADEVDLFDTVRVRFDGASFWFDQVDLRADPGAGVYLRQCLARMTDPRDLSRPGLTVQQAAAYAAAHDQRIRERLATEQERAEYRLRHALSHAGAALRDFTERGGIYRVTYDVDGRRHTSVIRKDDLTVQSAGICLSGQDADFDLHSLVGILREGTREGLYWGYDTEP